MRAFEAFIRILMQLGVVAALTAGFIVLSGDHQAGLILV